MVISTNDVLYLYKEEFAKHIHSVIKFTKIISLLLSNSSSSVALVSQSLSHVQLFTNPELQRARLFCPQGFPGKNTAVGYYSLLQGIFLDQGLNLYLLHWQSDSLPLTKEAQCSNYLCYFPESQSLGSLCITILIQPPPHYPLQLLLFLSWTLQSGKLATLQGDPLYLESSNREYFLGRVKIISLLLVLSHTKLA